jgi:predicted nucleic acid-binding protein
VTLFSGPSAIVVDASVAIEFLGGAPEWSDRWVAWADSAAMLLAPAHFPAEIANGLLRGRGLAGTDAAARLERVLASGIEIADRGPAGLREAVALAERHELTVYDALYLQLALDTDAELATLDAHLRKAAQAEDVALVG